MSRDKNGRKKTLATIVIIIGLVIASLLGIDVTQFFPEENGQSSTTITEEPNTNEEHLVIEPAEGELILTMFDVGQGDCFILQKGGQTFLIDSGTGGNADEITKYLKEMGVTKLDGVSISHPHADHGEAMRKIIPEFEVGVVWLADVGEDESVATWYANLKKFLKDNKYNIKYVEVGDTFVLDRDVIIEVIGPVETLTGNLNNYSTVMKITFGTMDIIMSGDAEIEVEKQILESGINIDAEIYKVAHHGSDTSNSEEFLDAISPEYGLISVGSGNRYDHPIKSVMENLEERDIEIYRTDESGTVTLTITPTDVTFDTEPDSYLCGEEVEAKK